MTVMEGRDFEQKFKKGIAQPWEERQETIPALASCAPLLLDTINEFDK